MWVWPELSGISIYLNMTSALISFSVVIKTKTMIQSNRWGKYFIWLRSHNSMFRVAMAWTQGMNLLKGTETEDMKECLILNCFPWLTQLAFFYNDTLHSESNPPTSICKPVLITVFCKFDLDDRNIVFCDLLTQPSDPIFFLPLYTPVYMYIEV